MLPLRDNIPARTFPIVNYTMIAVCGTIFLIQAAAGPSGQQLVERYGMIPVRVLDPDQPVVIEEERFIGFDVVARRERVLAAPPFSPWLTLLTCVFLHGGWMHLIGNMWFLHIFGDNVEDRLGHIGYLIFYLASGVAASAAHLFTNLDSPIPTIGASGAVAGVMGAYLLLYPRAMVLTLVPIVFILQVIVLPAPLFLGIWFLLQFFQGTMSIGSVQTEGVAWWAHIGGFLAGAAVAYLLNSTGHTRPRVDDRLSNAYFRLGQGRER